MTPSSLQMLLARMVAARREASHHLERVHRQIDRRAERLTVSEKEKASNRTHKRSGARWTRSDEMLFQSHVETLAFMRRGEIEALVRKLERQDRAIAVVRLKLDIDGLRRAA
ncbi:hypothetical protein ASG42_23515 [Rhizobium sp. Leaf391]|uniref:hypothetical protein n=1 Tax=Rhizobium sp. Leaf391 TaxID=1736360 RepID=UPI000714BC60|nr:hypothetical protein [Rhizobium sp. Leaf391]KQT04619.1 hypothetical protein ASG42_23515 [Rhizobium sp. Leaf391]